MCEVGKLLVDDDLLGDVLDSELGDFLSDVFDLLDCLLDVDLDDVLLGVFDQLLNLDLDFLLCCLLVRDYVGLLSDFLEVDFDFLAGLLKLASVGLVDDLNLLLDVVDVKVLDLLLLVDGLDDPVDGDGNVLLDDSDMLDWLLVFNHLFHFLHPKILFDDDILENLLLDLNDLLPFDLLLDDLLPVDWRWRWCDCLDLLDWHWLRGDGLDLLDGRLDLLFDVSDFRWQDLVELVVLDISLVALDDLLLWLLRHILDFVLVHVLGDLPDDVLVNGLFDDAVDFDLLDLFFLAVVVLDYRLLNDDFRYNVFFYDPFFWIVDIDIVGHLDLLELGHRLLNENINWLFNYFFFDDSPFSVDDEWLGDNALQLNGGLSPLLLLEISLVNVHYFWL